jgi:3'-phosphoadenosine 5'-phosphosulfate sulfotransferase (PAPS reductase)/FAD synthetase
MNNSEKKPLYVASCSFGKDSIATILLALEHNEPLDRVVFSEVMFDHKKGISGEIPEHIEWIYNTAIPRLEEMGVKVDVVRAKQDYVGLCNKILKSGKKAGCKYGHQNCRPCYANSDLKIAPIRSYLSKLKKDYDVVQYIGIAIDEQERLERLKGTNKVSLLQKYEYTEYMAMNKCREYSLLSPLYSIGYRGGCFFCFNANIERYIHIRSKYPDHWQHLKNLYYESDSTHFKYNKTLQEIEKEMDAKEEMDRRQLWFDFPSE